MPTQPGPPREEPIGLYIQRVAKELSRSFEAALAEVGGNAPTWLILVSLKSGRPETQRQLADAVGIRGATLTHHLEGLERNGLVARERDPNNRRVQKRKARAGMTLRAPRKPSGTAKTAASMVPR